MSILGIIALGVLIAALVDLILSIPFFVVEVLNDHPGWIATIMIGVFLIIVVVTSLIGIGVTTENERIFIAKYEMQKETVERSLASDAITPMERIELVNKVIELNGELAERKAFCDRWHVVLYDNHIYDNVEFINLD